jgi:2,4-dienoyl-CoA reductase-like NADH-dependent reductase (Old Yellow Enzyme family)/pyruvate/2-oxoglutarate dehydrogenase complex dihydrolipoamide dehydrogenase (E3) component
MSKRYPHVFQRIRIGPIEVANRFYFAPHGVPLNVGAHPSDDCVAYYAERAAGGCGLVMHSLHAFALTPRMATPHPEETIPSFRAVADAVHEHGTKIFGQLHFHWGVADSWQPLSSGAPSLGASERQAFDSFRVTHALGREEITGCVNAFRQSADHLRSAGYDGVEVHCTHGALAEHFLSPYFNQRTDQYGGSLENRMRFLLECLQAAREGAGPDLAVGVRFNCDEMLPEGLTQGDSREILARLVAEELIDFADLDIAVEPNQLALGMPSYFMAPRLYEGFVRAVREAAGPVPVLSALARVTALADAERVLADGTVDLVGAARGLIAEPELIKNAREGREERSRICVACNWCLEWAWSQGGCLLNPATGKERFWGIRTFSPAARPSKLVIAGGGPGGLEAARVGAQRGHDVVLLERQAAVGGQLNLWALLPGRDVFATAPDWWARELDRLGVDVRTNVAASAELVLGEQPDAVIVATGARYADDGESGFLARAIPGFERDYVYSPEQILDEGIRPVGRVVVLDDEGLNTGPGIAQLLADEGAAVELLTRHPQPALWNLPWTTEFESVIPQLKNAGVKLTTQTYIRSIGDHELALHDVFTNDERTLTNVDAVVLVTMRRSVGALARELDGKVGQLFAVGDALAPRMLAAATDEGHRFARMVGEPDAPRTFADAYFRGNPWFTAARPAAALPAAIA